MSIPKLKKIKSEKKYHDLTLSDEYAWVDQPNILEVLKDANKLDSEVKDYISENNKITEDYFNDVKDLQKNLFQEIKSKIKLDDTSLKFKDKKYFYWAKTEAKGNYGKRIRQLIDSSKPEENTFEKLTNFLDKKPNWLIKGKISKKWYGIRSRPDGEPSPIMKNLEDGLIICTGFYKNGILLAPACSKWVANEIKNYFS